MSKALYNRYRSQDFDQLVGQESITKLLKKAVVSGKVVNAYMFTGSRGTGKTSTARILAKALNCTNLRTDGNPCGECDNCMAISLGKFLDLVEIDAASNRGIDQIRELKEKIEFSPVVGKYKIYIIDEVHMLTKEAFNALLKTLEEPPKHVVFMLATTDIHKVPATILSRTQRYDFKLGSDEQLTELIKAISQKESVDIEDDGIKVIVKSARGSFRDAISLLSVVCSGPDSDGNKQKVTYDEVISALGVSSNELVHKGFDVLINRDVNGVISLIQKIEQGGSSPFVYISSLMEYSRDQMLDAIKSENEYSHILALLNSLVDVEKRIKLSSYPIVALEVSLLGITSDTQIVHKTPDSVKTHKVDSGEDLKLADTSVQKYDKKDVVIQKEERPAVEVKEMKAEKITEDMEEQEVTSTRADDILDSVKQADSSVNIDVSQADLPKTWSAVCEKVKNTNMRLYSFIKNSKVDRIDEGNIYIEVAFPFHKDTIDNLKNKEILVAMVKEVVGVPLRIVCNVNADVGKRRKLTAEDILGKPVVVAQSSTPKTDSNSSNANTNASGNSSNGGNWKDRPPLTEEQKKERAEKFSKKVEEVFAGM